jgi:hypothetical protein
MFVVCHCIVPGFWSEYNIFTLLAPKSQGDLGRVSNQTEQDHQTKIKSCQLFLCFCTENEQDPHRE